MFNYVRLYGFGAVLSVGVLSLVPSTAFAALDAATVGASTDALVDSWITTFQPLLLKYIGYGMALAGLWFIVGLFYRMIRNKA